MGTNGLTALGQQYMGVDNSRAFAIDRSGIYAVPYESQQGGSTGQISSQEQSELSSGLTGSGVYSQYPTFAASSASASDLVDKFYDATYCWGTDDEAMEAVLKSINKNNVMDVMKTWNKYHSKEKGESFMEAFMWDADGDQKVTYGKQISRALRDRAEAVGVYDEEMAAAFAKIDNELRCCYIENDIYEKFDQIIYKIAEAEADKLAANESDPEKKQEIKDKAMEYAKPYESSSETETGWDKFWAGAGEVCDAIGNFFFGWM